MPNHNSNPNPKSGQTLARTPTEATSKPNHNEWLEVRKSVITKSNGPSTNIEFWVPYSQRYLFNAIHDTNHNANPTNPNRKSKGNPNPTKPTNPNTRYRCENGTLKLNSVFSRELSPKVRFTLDVLKYWPHLH